MRTRSQPLSPGGAVSLEKEPPLRPATRQTRSMRAQSTEATAKSGSSQSQSSVQEQVSEESSQPAAGKKNGSASGKTAAAKKTKTTKQTTTSTKKTTTTTAKKSAPGRKAPTTKKTDGDEKPSAKRAKAPAKRTTQATTERRTTRRTATRSPEGESEKRTQASTSPEAIESDSRGTKSPARTEDENLTLTEAESSATDVLLEPNSSKLNRKRGFAESIEEVHETPQAKRRSVRAPVSTSLSRRLLPLSRRLSSTSVPYAERLRRRQAERQGRIHTTVFRLPELVAQNEADRRASETQQPTSPTPCPPAPQSAFDYPETPAPSRTLEERPSLQEPRTPESPSGWNIRGLLSSVPRSFTRFLPRFGRSQESADESDQNNQPFIFGQSGTDSSHQSPPSTPSASFPSNQPSSENLHRGSQSVQVPGGRRIRTPRTAPAKKPELSYDLFPRPIDRSLYLPPVSSTKKTNETQRSSHQGLEKEKQTPSLSESTTDSVEERATRDTDDAQAKKKRKRSPSPDVIPNPPGCSYGMDLRYFCYSSESEDEDETPTIAAKPTPLQKSAVRSELESEQHPSKRVRFDASPEDTPSKKRGRATDPYNGRHFLSPGEIPSPSAPDATDDTPPSPGSPSPSTVDAGSTPAKRRPGFIPNTQGTFGIDYDDEPDSSSSSSSTPADAASPAGTLPEQQTPRSQSQSQDSLQSPRATPRQLFGAPSTPSAKADNEALAKVRSQAEKYKPKTPSGLRTASRYSSSPMVASPDVAPTPSAELEKSMSEYSGSDKENAPADASATPAADKFGDDQFARDAEWLYEHCPSGDFNEFAWPSRRDLIEALEVDPEAGKVSNNAKDLENGPTLFSEDMAEFAAAFV